MKKKKALKLSVSLFLIFAVIISALAVYSYRDITPELYEPIEKIEFFGKWQSFIKDDAKLNKIVMPGSHDAACNGMMPLARTQGHDIYDQLKGGARYFDLRVAKKGDDLVIFHSIIKGMKFDKVLNDFNRFFKENPTEFVVMDFQKLGKNVNKEVLDAITSKLDMSKAMLKSDFSAIENTTIGEIREKGINFVIIWTDEEDVKNNDFLYMREKDLHSFYDRLYHMNPNGKKLAAHFPEYYERYDGTGFFVLQSQRTATIKTDKPSEMELKWGDEFTEFAKNLKDDPQKLEKTNIIMRDFIVSDMDKVRTILNLNLSKDLVKEENINEFELNTKVK